MIRSLWSNSSQRWSVAWGGRPTSKQWHLPSRLGGRIHWTRPMKQPLWCRRPTPVSGLLGSCCQEQWGLIRDDPGGVPGAQQGLMQWWRGALRWRRRQHPPGGKGEQRHATVVQGRGRPPWPLQQRLPEGRGGQAHATTAAKWDITRMGVLTPGGIVREGGKAVAAPPRRGKGPQVLLCVWGPVAFGWPMRQESNPSSSGGSCGCARWDAQCWVSRILGI